jgi:hypothetical protein
MMPGNTRAAGTRATSNPRRQHAGPGGAFVARVLLDGALPIDSFFVVLRREVIGHAGFLNGQVVLHGCRSCEGTVRGEQTSREVFLDAGPTRLPLTEDGRRCRFGRFPDSWTVAPGAAV